MARDLNPATFQHDLFGEYDLSQSLLPVEDRRRPLLPGLLAAGVGAAAAGWFAQNYGAPIILVGLLIGLAMSFVGASPDTHRGLDFASKHFLRAGIVVLGFQVTFAQIGALGPAPFVALLLVMAAALGAALAGARLVGQPVAAGVLAGGATAICGASAALALFGVLGKERVSHGRFALTLVGISLMSAIAMSTYPMLAHALGLTDRQAGFLIGASIHDVAQAIGGGFAFSDAAGPYATVVKLARVALLAPLVVLASLAFPPADAAGPQPLWRRLAPPWFIVAFLGLVAVNSLAPVPAPAAAWGLTLSKALLLLAVVASAMRSRLEMLIGAGWRAIVPVVAASAASFLAALAAALMLL